MLLQVEGDVDVFAALAAALLEVSDSSSSCLNHYTFSNAPSAISFHPLLSGSQLLTCTAGVSREYGSASVRLSELTKPNDTEQTLDTACSKSSGSLVQIMPLY